MRVVLVLVLVLVLVRPAGAAPPTGRLGGRVLDDTNTPISNATVTAESSDIARSTVTGPDGTFTFDDLLPGHYQVQATAEKRAPGTSTAVVEAFGDARVSLTVGSPPALPRLGPFTRGDVLSGLPLWNRGLPSALRLSLAARGRAGAHARFGAAQGNPEWRLDGFTFTHPITGAPAVAVGVGAVAAPGVAEASPGWWGVGPLADGVTRSGSNRYDAGAMARGGAGQGEAEADAEGAVIKDRLWFALFASGENFPSDARDRPGARGLGKVSWQVSSRDKVTLLAAGATGQPESARAAFGGLRWESLLRDDLVVSFHASALSDAGSATTPPLSMQSGSARAEYFLTTRTSGEHDLTLTAGGSRISIAQPSGRLSANRGHAALEERWRPQRSLTVTGTLGWTGAREPDGTVSGSSGTLAVTWDASRDGRTPVRLRAGSTLAPGLVALDCPDCPRATRVHEAAVGFERELGEWSAGGVELLVRRARLDGAVEARETLVAVHLNHRARAYKLSALYQGRLSPARSELLALAGLGLTRWLSAGVLAIYAPRPTWAPLFDETRAGPLEPAASDSAWLLGLQLRAELGAFLGMRSALWLDALNLTGDRGAVATRAGVPVLAPPRQLRAGFRVDY